MRSIDRQYYRILFITIKTRTRTINLACYCRYASRQTRLYIAVSKAIARHGYAGAKGSVTISRLMAAGKKIVDVVELRPSRIAA